MSRYVHDMFERERNCPILIAAVSDSLPKQIPSSRRRRSVRNRGLVERLERPIADVSGRPGRPYRAIDILAADGTSWLDNLRDAASWGGFSSPVRRRATGSTNRVRHFAREDGASFQLHMLVRNPDCGSSMRAKLVWRAILAAGGLGSAGRLLLMACPRLGTISERMGARTRVEWSKGEPRGCLRHSYCCARGTRITFCKCATLIIIILIIDKSG